MALIWEPLAQIITEHERATNPDHVHPIRMGESRGWALYLRRTQPMLEQVLRLARLWFPQVDEGVRWEASKLQFVFSSGFTYQFGACHEKDDYEKYYSSEYTLIMFDELVQFLKGQYDHIRTRLRTSDPVLREMLKLRAMSNPMQRRQLGETFVLDEDPQWVKKRFVDPAPLGRVAITRRLKLRSGEVVSKTRMYLPATLYDNPDKDFIRQYETNLADMPAHIQNALRYGSWEITEGAFFGEEWNKDHNVCEPFEVPRSWRLARSCDWGYKKHGCIHYWGIDEEENLFGIRELYFKGKLVPEVVAECKKIEEKLGTWKDGKSTLSGPADTQLWEQKGDRLMSKAEEFQRLGMRWRQADKRSRARNAELVAKRLKDHKCGTTTAGLVFFRTCHQAIRVLPAMQVDPHEPEQPMKMDGDHPYDSTAYMCADVSRGASHLASREDEDGDGWGSEDDDEEQEEERGRSGYGGSLY